MRIWTTAFAVLATAAGASAATITVKAGTPVDTISAAVELAAPGDTIVVPKGEYRENVDISGLNGLILVGQSAIWDGNVGGSSGECLHGSANDVHVKGFRFRNGTYQIDISGSGIVIEKCTFQGAQNYSIYLGDGPLADGSRISGCRFVGINYAVSTHGDGITIEKCYVRQSEGRPLEMYGNDAVFQKNTVVQINNSGLYIQGNDATVASNRFQNVDAEMVNISGDGAVVSKNKLFETDYYGIWIAGSGATVAGNTIAAASSTSISIDGSDNHVDGNRVSNCASDCIYTYGNGNSITGNKASVFFGDGINAAGDGAIISGNTLTDGDNEMIYVNGNNFSVTGNRLQRSSDNEGISAYNDPLGVTPKGTISGNTIEGTSQWGIAVNGGGITVSGNTVAGCGGMNSGGIYAYGSGAAPVALEGNVVKAAGGYGFRVGFGSTGVALVDCTATGSVLDGFFIPNGSGFSLTDCTATGSGGEGLDNRASATVLDGCVFKGNRIDVTNEYFGGGSFSDDITLNNTFTTGGDSFLPQVDYLP